jgi:hypothetical protein
MRRAFAILKYVPAVLCGLLVVAWVVSLFFSISTCVSLPAGRESALASWEVRRGDINFQFVAGRIEDSYIDLRWLGEADLEDSWLGRLEAGRATYPALQRPTAIRASWLYLPIGVLLTLLLPLAIGIICGFRFPLWSYFAWTALIAAELAYYLR